MKKLLFILLMSLCLFSCEEHTDGYYHHRSVNWSIDQINDSIVICIPTEEKMFGSNPLKAYAINIKNLKEDNYEQN